MTKKNHYKQWIKDIVETIESGKCPQDIVGHIQKHTTEDLNKYLEKDEPNWRHWSASMHNLIAIFDEMYLNGEAPTLDEKLARLRRKYENNKDTYTPEPEEG